MVASWFPTVRAEVPRRRAISAFGVPANGKPFQIDSCSVYRFEAGKVVEHWGMNDALTLLMQLGATPAPGG